MLRRLNVKEQWRSLAPGFWPTDVSFGRATVVYGHNGSGKSTLAELLLTLSEQNAATEAYWEPVDGNTISVRPGSSTSLPYMSVFTRKWVEKNLAEFLAGNNATAIVTLGEAAIEAKTKEEGLEAEVEWLHAEARQAAKRFKEAKESADSLARNVQDRIVTELQQFDYAHYTKNRYSIDRVCKELRASGADFPDDKAHADALVRLGETAPGPIPPVTDPPEPLAEEVLKQLEELLARTPTREALSELEANPQAQTWVRQGIELHLEHNHCFFCLGPVTKERRKQLAQHFDSSWLQIRSEAKGLGKELTRQRETLVFWLDSLPIPDSLASDLQPYYRQAVLVAKQEVGKRVATLKSIEEILRCKAEDPSSMHEPPDAGILTESVTADELSGTVRTHNTQAHQYEELTKERLTTVFDHIVGSAGQEFRYFEQLRKDAEDDVSANRQAVGSAEERLEELRRADFTTTEMADKLTADLAHVYGKDHLTITVSEDGKSYSCRRGDEAGMNLSDGERATLSLLYFLRNLENQQVQSPDPAQRIVVIDDPSSSLDREALFSTHQWLLSTLEDFGQYVVLTHDFDLLRLFITSHRRKWNKSVRAIDAGDRDEIHFPRVAFLELSATRSDGKPISKMGELPKFLRNSTTEYAYLFSMVMKGIECPEDHERLFLLPNAARRVLEVFASYKAPHRPNFLQQLESLVFAQPNVPFRSVYDFCNRFSHGEGHETVEVLDARSVYEDIRRCMEFMQSVDDEHFKNMCKAVNINPAIPA